MDSGVKLERPRSERVRVEPVPARRSPPKWAAWLLAATALVAGVGLWLYEPVETPPPRASQIGGPWGTTGPVIDGGEPVRVSTALGEMVWQRVAGAQYADARASMEQGPVTLETLVSGSGHAAQLTWSGRPPEAGHPPTAEGYEGEMQVFTVPGLSTAIFVEAPDVPIRVYTLLAGKAGALLLGEPWGSAATVAWVQSDDATFGLVGTLPFWIDYVGVGARERPLAYPVDDGYVAFGRAIASAGEVSVPRPGQELWSSADGRSWSLANAQPLGERDAYILVLTGHSGRWLGIQPSRVEQPGWVWVSDDALEWKRAVESPLHFGFCSIRITGGEMGWVARDCGDHPLWLSRDGIEWHRLPAQDALFGDFDYVQGDVWVGEDQIIIDSGVQRGQVGWIGRLVAEQAPG